MDILSHVTYWHWFIAAFALGILELLIPGTWIFLWSGISAVCVGLIVFIFPATIDVKLQLLLFSVLAVVAIFVMYNNLKKVKYSKETETLNQRCAAMVGKQYVVAVELKNGSGKIKVADTLWLATGEDTAVGDMVEVVGFDKTTLEVKKLN